MDAWAVRLAVYTMHHVPCTAPLYINTLPTVFFNQLSLWPKHPYSAALVPWSYVGKCPSVLWIYVALFYIWHIYHNCIIYGHLRGNLRIYKTYCLHECLCSCCSVYRNLISAVPDVEHLFSLYRDRWYAIFSCHGKFDYFRRLVP